MKLWSNIFRDLLIIKHNDPAEDLINLFSILEKYGLEIDCYKGKL